jgi:flavin-binding protein dodecin
MRFRRRQRATRSPPHRRQPLPPARDEDYTVGFEEKLAERLVRGGLRRALVRISPSAACHRTKEQPMADVAKVITIIGSSPESFAKAADAAVQEASKTLRGITGADVVSMSAVVENDRISEYRTTVNIAFAVER